MADKTATVTISISTNMNFAERYFVDLRDTTGGRNRQMRTWHLNQGDARRLVLDLQGAAERNGVALTATDTTGEVEIR